MIAITGAAGFIGAAITRELNARGVSSCHLVDSLGRDKRWENLKDLKFSDYEEKESFLKRVIFDDPALKTTVDGIIHMGACSSTTEQDASFLIENNYKYSQVLAKWCIKNGKRFVYASSAATYGDGSMGFDDNEEKISDLRPLNMYGYSKQLMDLWARNTGSLEKIAGIKFFNVYGPGEAHKGDMRSVAHKAYGQILKEGKLKLFKSYREGYEDGGQLRDFIYVKDAVNMTLYIYEKNVNGLFNAGSGKARSFADLGRACFKALGKAPVIEYIDMPEDIRGKYQYFTEAKMDKIKIAGFDGKIHTLEQGIEDYMMQLKSAERQS